MTEAQSNDKVRPATVAEMRRAILIGKRVKINTDPDKYGYLYKDELYVATLKENNAT